MILGMNKSIFRRLLFSYMFTVLLGLGGLGILISFLAKGYIYDATKAELLRKAKNVNLSIQNESQITDNSENILSFLDQSFNARIWVFNREGKIIATSTKDEVSVGKSVHPSIVRKILNGENAVNELEFEGLTEPMLSVAIPWGKENKVYGGIVLHSPVVGINETIGNIREAILWATLFGMLLSTAMVSYLSWSISRPLQKIDRMASKMGMGNYDEQIHIRSSDEIGDLANTINNMAKKLHKIDKERKNLDQIRNDFLANVSHELRTPLTAMQGFLEALQDGIITNEQGKQKYYDVMYQETMHMNRLVDDLMDLIKLENKEITLSKQSVDVASLLNKVVFKFKPKALDKNLEVAANVQQNLKKVHADPDRLEQIIDNIVKNAVKFTDEGKITVKGENDGSYVLISISDTGMGISNSDQELIWERFFKVDRGRSKKNKGTGLGLAIVKELVDMHQGKITVQSEMDKGTTFKVWIPSIQS